MTCFFDAGRVRELMNRCGARRRPFLFAVNFEMTEGLFAENPLACSSVGFSVNGVGNREGMAGKSGSGAALLEARPMEFAEYARRFGTVRRGLLRGDSFLANLTVRTPVVSGLSLEEIFMRAEAPYLLYVPGRFVCFSPERFVRIAGGRIATNPMKGTINASVPDARQTILNDPKETARTQYRRGFAAERPEHPCRPGTCGAVPLHRPYCHTPRRHPAGEFRDSRPPAGRVRGADGRHPFRYASRRFGIGGPKSSTLRIIREAEGEPRGYYTGVFGYFDGQTLDSAVLIRFIEEEQGRMYFRSGGGITAYSDCRSEYEEVIEKVYLPFV